MSEEKYYTPQVNVAKKVENESISNKVYLAAGSSG
jgi:hypothetical protein